MLEENMSVKPCPESILDTELDFDVIITLDTSSTDVVYKELGNQQNIKTLGKTVHIIEFPLKDELKHVKNGCHHVAVLASIVS